MVKNVIKETINGKVFEYIKVNMEIEHEIDQRKDVFYFNRPNDSNLYILKNDYIRLLQGENKNHEQKS